MNLEKSIHSRQVRGCVAMWRWIGRGRKEITELHELIQLAACSKSYAGFGLFGHGPLVTVKMCFWKKKKKDWQEVGKVPLVGMMVGYLLTPIYFL